MNVPNAWHSCRCPFCRCPAPPSPRWMCDQCCVGRHRGMLYAITRRISPPERRHVSGQAMVEFILLLPVLLLVFLGGIETWRLYSAMGQYHDATVTLADDVWLGLVAYPSPQFDTQATEAFARANCDLVNLVVDNNDYRTVVSATCSYHALVYAALSVPVSVDGVR